MKNIIRTILGCLPAFALLAACHGPVPSEDPFAMADRFAEAFLVKADPDQMSRYCDAQGRTYVDSCFNSVMRRSPEMYEYLAAWTRGMRFGYERLPHDVFGEGIPADSAAVPDSAIPTDSSDMAIPYSPQPMFAGVADLTFDYLIRSQKDTAFVRTARVYLRKDGRERWRVCGSDLTFFL